MGRVRRRQKELRIVLHGFFVMIPTGGSDSFDDGYGTCVKIAACIIMGGERGFPHGVWALTSMHFEEGRQGQARRTCVQ